MAGFDEGNVFYASSIVSQGNDMDAVSQNVSIKMKFNQFIRNFKHKGFDHHYRDVLLQNYNNGHYFLKVHLDDLNQFDSTITNDIIKNPDMIIDILEEVVNTIAEQITRPRSDDQEFQHIQVILASSAASRSLREITANEVSKLVKLSGIVLSASEIRSKATSLTLQCRGCNQFLPNLLVKPGFTSFMLPRKCNTVAANARVGVGATNNVSCPLDPYFIVPDKSHYIDYQTVKLQELPEHVPHGELPRHCTLYCDKYLCDKSVPGSRVTVIGINSVFNSEAKKTSGGNNEKGLSVSYIRVLGIEIENSGSARSGTVISSGSITEEEEKDFRAFAQNTNAYKIIARSIAPNIFGFDDIKKAIACLLMAGSRKRMNDGLTRRGDINVLLLGDPGTAKSQLLKFVSECAPISVYTSGKGSSAAGLTASVIRDNKSKKFVMEGGAMVLADGGIVCIDEFDKMREEDRVAIHEAMEQQTISIAKAGITTMLNSRCAVLAAANSVYGKWEEGKGSENIDLMPTILSRFDMIFIVRDVHDENRDLRIATHNMHIQRSMFKNVTYAPATQEEMDKDVMISRLDENGIIPKLKLKKYIAYCRSKCGPRLSQEASTKLINQYTQMRSGRLDYEKDSGKKSTIPITVRQLEAMIRIAESLAKMRLSAYATEQDIDESIRLFQVSTLDAALTGSLEGVEELNSREDFDVLTKLEKLLKKRMVVGSQVSEQVILQDFISKGFPEWTIKKVLNIMIRRGELQPRMQNRVFLRVK